jgi:CheY-like chemotaxis protein
LKPAKPGREPEQPQRIAKNAKNSRDDSVRNAAIQAGAIAYFVKPFDDDAFLAAVHQAMASES